MSEYTILPVPWNDTDIVLVSNSIRHDDIQANGGILPRILDVVL
jgi:hypothetical protein